MHGKQIGRGRQRAHGPTRSGEHQRVVRLQMPLILTSHFFGSDAYTPNRVGIEIIVRIAATGKIDSQKVSYLVQHHRQQIELRAPNRSADRSAAVAYFQQIGRATVEPRGFSEDVRFR